MKKLGIKLFIILFIISPSFVGGYSLFFGEIESNSKSGIAGNSEEAINEIIPNNPKNARSDIVYKPIESALNLSRLYGRDLDPLDNATNTVEYNLLTGLERVISKQPSLSSTFPSIVEPFEGILDTKYGVEDTSEENEEGLQSSYVFSPDGRQKITSVTDFPWRTICKLYIQAQNGSYYMGSGAIIDEFHVLTCGHCVYIPDAGGWASEIIVIPGTDSDTEPYGRAYASDLRSYTGWTVSQMVQHDWAVITLNRSIGRLTGWMGRQTAESSNSIYTGSLGTAGYPGDLDYGMNMYYDYDVGDRATEYNHWYWMDTFGGQSGSPIWRYEWGARYILSINAYEYREGSDANFGTRLNEEKFNQINTWLAEDNFSVVYDKPDLLDRGYSSGVNTAELIMGETSFEIYSEVINEGTVAAASFDVSFYISPDGVIGLNDYLLGRITINNLDPFSYVALNWSGEIPLGVPNGSYYVGWIIDSEYAIQEFNESNNIVLLDYPLVEIQGPLPPDYGAIFITVFIFIGLISFVSLTVFLLVKRRRALRFEEGA